MPAIALLNRYKLQQLAEERLSEAKLLMDGKHYTGAYYLTGLGIECALKACIAKLVKEFDFPDKSFVKEVYIHGLDNLMKFDTALSAQLQAEMQTDTKLQSNWNTVRTWNDSYRYEFVTEIQARSLLNAATDERTGIMDWIRKRW